MSVFTRKCGGCNVVSYHAESFSGEWHCDNCFGRPQKFEGGVFFLPPEVDLCAMQPVGPPMTVTTSTGNAASKVDEAPGWAKRMLEITNNFKARHIIDPDRETDEAGMRRAAEEISVKWQKRDDLDAAMLKACRAALSKLREWPRCKDHDAAMQVKCCLPFSGNGKRYAFAGCGVVGCGRTSSPVEVKLDGATERAIDGEAWTAEGFRA